MMIKITSKCSMNCSHCMNDAKPTGRHMSFEVFKDAIKFQNKYGGPVLMLTGGEPFEHPQWPMFFEYAQHNVNNALAIEVTTNGKFIQENYHMMANYIRSRMIKNYPVIMFQVCNDTKYYPYKLERNLDVFDFPNVAFIDNVPNIYPQGRARNMPHHAKSSKCYNIRAVVKQSEEPSLQANIMILAAKEKVCTPHIDIDGNIKLGESDLCPVCSSIYKPEEQIMEDIRNFCCHTCDFINKNLPEQYRKIIET